MFQSTQRPVRRRQTVVIASLILVIVAVLLSLAMLSPILWGPMKAALHTPGEADGRLADGISVTLDATHLPAISRLDPELREAMLRAETDAAADGVTFEITSGWRSAELQQWMLDERIELWADEELARQFVATPENSHHVTGDAVDIASLDAQLWLIDNGSRYGLCQTYSNERWHFELATEPGGVCPTMLPDAAG
ncbi:MULTISPECIES: M15 family metallopeptidase [unclassified Microbacterium]|uniref:M15 family metallopeptidase n=1 Tax=unclassified Microbacterium TaxID=2609290 RepID=UPI00214BA2A5|nr:MULTISPECIES: M15 family metallopeptidase [unclassified Microbacterium]MCR2783925.1 M15 family metallopeptidase [Microbacterium sp. zg.B96]WIM15230.1 M15 family metallopeptidase [Microbacterium sp. zg-B96]